jgi:hypothetical protein
MITLSLNEIDAAVKRAARGAGLSWGLAEDAGKAARLLAQGSICGLDLVLRALRHEEQGEPGSSPFRIGSALCDGALPPDPDGGVRAGPVRDPAMLLGYAALTARAASRALAVSWPGCDVVLCDGAAEIRCAEEIDAAFAGHVRIADAAGGIARRAQARRGTEEETWSALLALGQRTFVPPTARSRETGAGAGLSDND